VVGERRAARLAARLAGLPPGCVEADSCPWRGLLASIDGYSASESMLPWMSWRDWGWKAAVAAASDLAASGGEPGALLVSIGAPSGEAAVEASAGVGEAAAWMGAEVIGGDTNRCGGDAWIDVAVLGALRFWAPRWTARPGDLLVRVGCLGCGALAALALEGRVRLEDLPGGVVEYTRRPRPPLGLAGLLWEAGCRPSAGVDNSDGWGEALWSLAEASRVRIVVEVLEATEPALSALEALGLHRPELVAASGEDYTILLSAPPGEVECILAACRRSGLDCGVIGRVEEGGPAVLYRGSPLPRGGWDSFAAHA
jgi:thiamine-monophosphate kinase